MLKKLLLLPVSKNIDLLEAGHQEVLPNEMPGIKETLPQRTGFLLLLQVIFQMIYIMVNSAGVVDFGSDYIIAGAENPVGTG